MRSIVETKLHFSPEVLQIAAIAKAMSHPVRLYILQKLSGMESCCHSGDLVDGIPIGRSAFSRHLKELKYDGLIQGELETPFTRYCLKREK